MSDLYLDFETEAIQPRHIEYPPKPVGLAVCGDGIEGEQYMAFGHPTENNCTYADVANFLTNAYNSGACIWFHNAKFDLDVTETHFEGIPLIPRGGFGDTLPLYFVHNPHAREYGLKPTVERELGVFADDQSKLREWVFEHVPGARRAPTKWGAHISKTPGGLAGFYAKSDVRFTKNLREHVEPKLDAQEMAAYRRELALIPVLLGYEREGVPIDYGRLEEKILVWEGAMVRVDQWIWQRLGKEFNVNSGPELTDAILVAGKGSDDWELTPKSGNPKSSMDAIQAYCTDAELVQALAYRSKMKVSLGTFAKPWCEQALATGGIMHTTWFSSSGEAGGGARTGRMSSRPNFQNAPKRVARLVDMYDAATIEHYRVNEVPYLPIPPTLQVPALPVLRDYIIADPGGTLIDRDYSQQELRILAHYEDGVMLQQYLDDPRLDFHDMATALVNAGSAKQYHRGAVKTVVFGLVYGMGVGKLAKQLGLSDSDARGLRNAILSTFPGMARLNEDLKYIGKSGGKIRTWGGRRYAVEPAKFIDGRHRTFEYKLLNVLIQGSAADCTKQALLNYDSVRKNGRVLLIVHDEILATTQGDWKHEMELLRQAMESVKFDVPMLSEGKADGRTWASLKKHVDA